MKRITAFAVLALSTFVATAQTPMAHKEINSEDRTMVDPREQVRQLSYLETFAKGASEKLHLPAKIDEHSTLQSLKAKQGLFIFNIRVSDSLALLIRDPHKKENPEIVRTQTARDFCDESHVLGKMTRAILAQGASVNVLYADSKENKVMPPILIRSCN